MTGAPNSGLRLAATAIPLREGDDGLEVLMVKRNESLSFGGMWTFPGGTLEDIDGPTPPIDDEDGCDWGTPQFLAAAAAGAVRETREETNLSCALASLAWYSHWIPPEHAKNRFATWFFLAPEVYGELVVDKQENSQARWLTPRRGMEEHADANFPMVAPTWCTLYDLDASPRIDALIDRSITQGPYRYQTRALRNEEGLWLVWLGDASYESGDLQAAGPRNRALVDQRFAIVERLRG